MSNYRKEPHRRRQGYSRGRTARRFTTKKTQWDIDIWRIDPHITKTEQKFETISPCPKEIIEQSKPSVEFKVGNQTIASGVAVSKESTTKSVFPEDKK